MTAEILLLGVISEYNVLYFFTQIKEALEKDAKADFLLRVNCRGGNPEYSMSIISKVQEMKEIKIQVDGMAHSMAAWFLLYVKEASSIDTAQYLLHRASYGEWAEAREDFKGSIAEQSLIKTNKDLEKAFRAKVDVEAFENLKQCKDKNITVESLFSMESGREEVLLTPADMKKIGLIQEIIKITPTKTAQIEAMYNEYKGCTSLDEYKKAAEKTAALPEPKKDNPMTIEEFKAAHPAEYAKHIAEIEKTAKADSIKAEQDRVGAWMAFEAADKEAVQKGIKEGRVMTQTEMAELTVKLATGNITKQAVNNAEEDSAAGIKTDEVVVELGADGKPKVKTEAEKNAVAFEKSVLDELGLGKK
jgi:ATP-dependent protease ClpP protease subunit